MAGLQWKPVKQRPAIFQRNAMKGDVLENYELDSFCEGSRSSQVSENEQVEGAFTARSVLSVESQLLRRLHIPVFRGLKN